MFVDTVQVWIDEWKVEGKVEGKAYAIIEMLEDGDISYEKALKKITLLRTQLNDEAFWKDIDLRLERFK
jgi:aminopeptidase N